ncbi:MAG: RNA 2',3'-cyclic phosphodiesterase [Thermodesulfovibrio sp.]|nr:RNA 2',3'-cyclic phosphodiesterase [Thermodesulfovibrio sp.]
MRCFIAIELSEDIKKFIDKLININFSIEGVSLVKKENLHLTLKFLGEVETELIPKLNKSLNNLANEFSPFILKISHPGVFPDKLKPRIIWIGLESSEVLKELAAKIDEEMSKYGFEREQREFKAHITLARVKNPRNGRYIFEKILKSFKEKALINNSYQKDNKSPYFSNRISEKADNLQFQVREFVLMKSTLTPKGSIYEVLERFPLNTNINGIIKQNA